MIVLSIASAIYLVAAQNAAANSSRSELVACLSAAVTKAKADKVAADAFAAFATEQCTAPATSLKAALVAIDLKYKVPRKQAQADADSQVLEFVTMAAERFAASAPAPK